MTRDELFKLIAENTNGFMKEQVLRDAVDAYTEALLQQTPCSASLRNKLRQVISDIEAEQNRYPKMQTTDVVRLLNHILSLAQ